MWIQLIHLLNIVTAPINTYLINFYYTRYHRTWRQISYVFLIPLSYTIFSVCLSIYCLSVFSFPAAFLLHEIFLLSGKQLVTKQEHHCLEIRVIQTPMPLHLVSIRSLIHFKPWTIIKSWIVFYGFHFKYSVLQGHPTMVILLVNTLKTHFRLSRVLLDS